MRTLTRVVTVINLSRLPGDTQCILSQEGMGHPPPAPKTVHIHKGQISPLLHIRASHCSPVFLQQGGPHPTTRKEQVRPPHLWAEVTLGGWTAGAQSCRSLFYGPRGSSGDLAMPVGIGHSQEEHSASPWTQQALGGQRLEMTGPHYHLQ